MRVRLVANGHKDVLGAIEEVFPAVGTPVESVDLLVALGEPADGAESHGFIGTTRDALYQGQIAT